MKVALAQISSTTHPVENLDMVGKLTIQARHRGAQAIVFPEATLAGFHGQIRRSAQRPDGFFASALTDLASSLQMTIIAGTIEVINGSDKLDNVLLVCQPDGQTMRYYKRHLFDAAGNRESDNYRAGDKPLLFALGDMTAAAHICYDVRFPADFIADSQAGASVHIVSASWNNFEGGADTWTALLRARALDSVSWVIGVGQAHNPDIDKQGPYGCGYSALISPDGKVISQAGSDDELLIVSIGANAVHSARKRYPILDQQ